MDSSVFPIPPQPAQRAADKEWRFRARAASGPRSPTCSRDGFRFGLTDLSGRKAPTYDGWWAPWRRAGAFSERQGGAFAANMFRRADA